MRKYITLIMLFFIFFILPLQVFIIGDYSGIGVQGAVYRYQTTGYGTAFFPITREMTFVLDGIYTEKTALSIILWITGTILLACTIIFASINVTNSQPDFYRQIMYGLIGSCLIYFSSCIAQYGFLFHGPAGFSLPLGIITILCWSLILYYYQNISHFFSNFH